MAPGYIPGSGRYNGYDLSSQTNQFGAQYGGLFSSMPLAAGGTQVVNNRFGLGGTGDRTTGAEVQTPQRYISGVATDSGQAMRGDERWRREHPGGGGWDASFAGVPAYQPGPSAAPAYGFSGAPYTQNAGGGGYQDPYQNAYLDAAGGGGTGGGFFGSTVASNWGQTAETAGKDYIATLFLRSDTPTGIVQYGTAGNDSAISVDGVESWPPHAIAANDLDDVAASPSTSSAPGGSYELHRAARAYRSLMLGSIIVAAIQAVVAIARRAYARHRQRQRASAIYDVLRKVDDRTLRDIGVDRGEIWSVATEKSGKA